MRAHVVKYVYLSIIIFCFYTVLSGKNSLYFPKIQSDSLYVNPTSIYVDIDPGAQVSEILTICNQSDTAINYYLEFESSEPLAIKPKYYCREEFQYSLSSNFEHGVETDGEYIYISQKSTIIFKYDPDGNLLDTLNIEGANTVWDLAFDGYFFYGGSGQNFIYEMDFENEELISVIYTSVPVEALAYNENLDVFYGTAGNVLTCFDRNGITLNEIPVDIENLNGFSGLAYDGYSHGGPFIWAYGYHLYSMNLLIRLPLTGTVNNMIMCDVAKIIPTITGVAGGLCIDNHLNNGYWTICGITQNNLIFGLELTYFPDWFSYEPGSGFLDPGDCDEIDLIFNPLGELLPAGYYDGSLYVTSEPDIGDATVEIEMVVMGGYFMPVNLTAEIVGKSVVLNWEHPLIPGDFDYRVYANTHIVDVVQNFTSVHGPLESGIELYYIGTVLPGSNYTETSFPVSVIITEPQLIPPINFEAVVYSDTVISKWVSPGPVSDLFGFNIYRNGEKLNTIIITDTFHLDLTVPSGTNYYYATAVYEYGESGASDTAFITISHTKKIRKTTGFSIFPNPASEMIFISFPSEVQSFQVLNNNGVTIIKKDVKAGNIRINISDLDPGIYYFRILSNFGTQVKKVILVK